ncbi:hypothetical protein HMPREF1141_2957 [Clostridium sp. MSTE9]|nr:hypothetical protein HMPREF1141_2957 [Clostridium sp. MSTE9]
MRGKRYASRIALGEFAENSSFHTKYKRTKEIFTPVKGADLRQ